MTDYAFDIRNLSVLSYAQGYTAWLYCLGYASTSVALRQGFFDDAADMLAAGDTIMVTSTVGAALLWVRSAGKGKSAVVEPMLATRGAL